MCEYLCFCVSVYLCARMYRYPLKKEKVVGSHGVGVSGSCKLLCVGTGNITLHEQKVLLTYLPTLLNKS